MKAAVKPALQFFRIIISLNNFDIKIGNRKIPGGCRLNKTTVNIFI